MNFRVFLELRDLYLIENKTYFALRSGANRFMYETKFYANSCTIHKFMTVLKDVDILCALSICFVIPYKDTFPLLCL